jgi:hypothetical protein
MTLLDAPAYNAKHYRHLREIIWSSVAAVIVIPILLFIFWNWPSEHRVNNFLDAVQTKQYVKAYGIWNHDAHWQDHQDRYAHTVYPYKKFLLDWGAGGSEGTITSHKILYATSTTGNTVILAVELNGKPTPLLTLAVSKKDHTIGFTPFDLSPQGKFLWFTRWGIAPAY